MKTSVWRRMNAVRTTYTTRISFWVVSPVVILCLVGSWNPAGFQAQRQTSVQPEPDRSGGVSASGPDQLLKEKDSIRYLSCMPNQPFQPGTLKQLPNLRGLALYSIESPDVWREVAELSQLRSLEIVGDLPNADICPSFTKLKDLEFLRFLPSQSSEGLERFAELPNLHTLDINGAWRHHGMNWAWLPQFQSVRVVVLSGVWPKRFYPEAIQALRSMPNLKRVYLHNPDNNEEPFAGFDSLRRELSGIELRPDMVNTQRFFPLAPAIFGIGVAMFALGLLHLATQFSTPAARLIPNFAGPHIFIGATIWLIVTGSAWGAIWSAGNVWWTSLSIAVMPTALTNLILLNLQNPSARRTAPLILQRTVLAVLIPLCCFAPIFIGMQTSLLDWYLRGEMPFLTAVLGLGSLATTLLAGRQLIMLHPVMQELGLNTFPVQLDLARSIQSPTIAVENSAWPQHRVYWLAGLQAKRLERFARGSRPEGWRSLATRWTRGNIYCGLDAVWFIPSMLVTLCVMAAAFEYFMGRQVVPNSGFLAKTVIPMFVVMTFVITIPMALQWFMRQPLLGYESMRPVTRQQFIREVWTAVVLDQLPPFLMQAALIAVASLWRGQTGVQLATTLAMLPLPWMMVIAWLLIGLSIRPSWRLFVVAGLAYFTSFAPAVTVAGLLDGQLKVPGMAYAFLGFLLLACVLLAIARYRWQRMEFGMLK